MNGIPYKLQFSVEESKKMKQHYERSVPLINREGPLSKEILELDDFMSNKLGIDLVQYIQSMRQEITQRRFLLFITPFFINTGAAMVDLFSYVRLHLIAAGSVIPTLAGHPIPSSWGAGIFAGVIVLILTCLYVFLRYARKEEIKL